MSLPVKTDEIRRGDDLAVGAVDPRSPGIHVSDLCLHALGADHASHVVNLLGQGAGAGVAAVEVLRANGDGDDPVAAVGGDGVEQSLLLGVVVVGVFGPDTDEDLGACGIDVSL